ncbi:hypothetical protein NL463_30205, partial [Klebsiella pneumoniae]|nr:hypothetical protein [Klebsiella pneumoniae]
ARTAALATVCVLCGGAASAPPAVTSLYPAGLQRGTSADVTAAGTFGTWPCRVWVSGTGVTAVPGKTKGTVTLAAAADSA